MNMKRFIERNLAIIIIITVIAFAFSSCASSSFNSNPAYEGWNAGCGKR